MKPSPVRPLALALSLVASTAAAGDWPVYRGPDHDLAVRAGALEVGRPVGLDVAWRRAAGSGYSGVSIADGAAVTMFEREGTDWLVAFAAADGRELWRVAGDATYAGHDGSHDGPISTPLLAAGRVFALTPRGRFFAVELATGEVAWSLDLTADDFGAEAPYYGFSTSPILVAGVVVLQIGAAEKATVAGFDPETGDRLWSVGGDSVQYQSPMRIELDGREQVLAIGDEHLFGVDPATGELLWQAEHGGDGSSIGGASTNATPAGANRFLLVNKADQGTLFELHSTEAGVEVETLWTSPYFNNTYTVPVYHDGYLYGYGNRFMVCLDAETGEPAWKSRQPGDGFLMLLDDHLVILTKRGSLHVAEASGEGYREVAALDLFEDNAWTAPSFAGGDLWLRSFGEIARVRLTGAAEAGTEIAAAAEASPAGAGFAAFLDRVAAASDPGSVVDEFLAGVESFPLVEDGGIVHFLYRGEASDVAIVGDLIEGRHQEPMLRVPGTDLYYYTAEVAPDATIKYRFVVDFETDVLDERNPDRVEMVTLWAGEYSWLEMPAAVAPAWLRESGEPAERHGRLEVVELPVEGLDELRKVEVYLPPGYDESDARYPVAYVHQGGAVREHGRWPTALDNLIGRSVRPLIVAFVHPAGPPGFETRPPGATRYAEAFAGQIVEAIDERYRTLPRADARASVGLGFNGVAAFLSAFGAPEVFGRVAAQSPFMLSSMEDRLRAATPLAAEAPFEIYLDWGRYDPFSSVENWNLIESSRRTAAYLRERGYEPAGGEFNAGFGFPSWRLRTAGLLEALFPLEG